MRLTPALSCTVVVGRLDGFYNLICHLVGKVKGP